MQNKNPYFLLAMAKKDFLISKLKAFLSGNIGIIFAYFLLALLFTFPLILNFNNTLVGTGGDTLGTIPYFWFFKYSLFDLHLSPFAHSDLMFYPAGFNIGDSYENLLAVIVSIPLQIIFKNMFTVYNLIVIFNFVFSAYTSYLLVKYLVNDKKISFMAGIMFGFSSYMLARGLGHINMLTTGAIPLFILFFLKLSKDPSRKNSLTLAVLFLLVALSSWQYGLFILIFVFFSLVFLFFTARKSILNKKYLTGFVLFLVLSALLVLPFILPMATSKTKNEMNPPINDEYIVFSADVIGYLTPTPSSTLFGKFIPKDYFNALSGNVTESTIYLGLFEIIFIFDFFLTHRKKLQKTIAESAYWITSAIVFFILSLGPQLKVLGYFLPVMLPYYFIYNYLPFFSFAKEPARLGIFVMLFVAIIFSIYLKANLDQRKTQKNIILLIFAVIIIAERIEVPYQTYRVEVPSFYNKIAEEKTDYAILDLPANIRWFQQPVYNFFQTIHKKKIIISAAGYTMFFSDSYSWIDQNAFVSESRCYSPREKEFIPADGTKTDYDKDKTIRSFKEVNIKYVVVHKDIIAEAKNYDFNCRKAEDNIDQLFRDTRPVFEDKQIAVYELY